MFKLCPPALIYLCFSIIQIIIDILKQHYEEALFKFVIMIVITLMLNILCEQNLIMISWIIVFVPFILMTEMILMLAYIFGINMYNGTIDYKHNTHANLNNNLNKTNEKEYPSMFSSSPAYESFI
jgi:hypothetical protein